LLLLIQINTFKRISDILINLILEIKFNFKGYKHDND